MQQEPCIDIPFVQSLWDWRYRALGRSFCWVEQVYSLHYFLASDQPASEPLSFDMNVTIESIPDVMKMHTVGFFVVLVLCQSIAW